VGSLLKFCEPRTGGPRPFDPATYLRGNPPEKKRPPRPSQGQRSAPDSRGRHRRVTHGGPPPTTPLAGCPPPQVRTTAREAKKQPNSAPGCPHQIA
jgi:hypothetical protein